MFAVSPNYPLYDLDDVTVLRLADELMDRRYPTARSAGEGYHTAPSRSRLALNRPGESEIHNTDKEFRIHLDLHHYRPEEVKITCENLRITINAKHEERQDDHGLVSREVTRTYKLPKDVDAKSVTSTMNSNGVLNIKVAKKAIEAPQEVPVTVEINT